MSAERMSHGIASFIAFLVVFGGATACALAIGWAAHHRMARVEATARVRAVPKDETALLWYCLASLVWLSAAVVAVVGVSKREWARLGRNATWMFLAHMLVAVIAAFVCAVLSEGARSEPPSLSELVPLLTAACAIAGANCLVACALAWVWAGRRRDRIERDAGTHGGNPAHAYRTPWADGSGEERRPGVWRFALYAGSLVFWPVGLVAVMVLSKPVNASVGAWAFRFSLVQIAMIAVAVCGGIPVGLALI